MTAPFTSDRLIEIERHLQRTVSAVSRIANDETVAALQDVEYILAEIRHAGWEFACNKDEKVRADITRRLLALFTQ